MTAGACKAPIPLSVLLAVFALTACGDEAGQGPESEAIAKTKQESLSNSSPKDEPAEPPPTNAAVDSRAYFTDVAADWGLTSAHHAGRTTRRFLPEIMGSGAAFADFDGDGRLDLYLVQQRELVGKAKDDAARNTLMLQTRAGHFEKAGAGHGAGDLGCGLGCAVADFDGDGDQDIYVCNVGANVLLRNDGKGKFTDISLASGTADPRMSVSASFFDYDRDGDLDLFVVNYVDWSVEKNVDTMVNGILTYSPPHAYRPIANRLYRNEGNGRFVDVSVESGIAAHPGKGLGIAVEDYDDDGWLDVYVANDNWANFLFHNQGDGSFEEVGLESGVAYSESGVAEAGMGVDGADIDGDGLADILVTNFAGELNNYFANEGDLLFEESARARGFGSPSLSCVGFGIRAFDYENDGDLDVYVANGHIADNIAEYTEDQTFPQADLFFLNEGQGKMEEKLGEGNEGRAPRVGRGIALGDIDDDGDLDLLISNNGGVPYLLRNDQKAGHTWVGLDLVGKGANRDAIGARVRVGDTKARHLKLPRSSYLSAHDARMIIPLQSESELKSVVVIWPSGERQPLQGLKPNSYHRVVED